MINLANKIVEVFENKLLPMTQKSVGKGNKIFGAAILNKENLSLIVAGTNNELENPLWHGEVNTLKKFYELPIEKRPLEKNCIFITSHEPCSLCLSAITFSGFDNFYYLYPYETTLKDFNIPHDLKILKEVFGIENGNYNKTNTYWSCVSIIDLIKNTSGGEKVELNNALDRIKDSYKKLSEQYQSNKQKNKIPLK
tara:strand:- start:1117 stop:1704 length:588 start_codon:yes stop_codon:yes gene_type:complete